MGKSSHTLRLASLLGLPAVKANVEGVAQMDLQIAGSWTGNISGDRPGFSLPAVTGTVELHNVRATVRGVSGPIEIASADLHLLRDEARVEKLTARAADAQWAGSLALPRGCGMPGACVVRFNLSTEEMGLSEVAAWLGSPPSQRRWYQVLASRTHGTGVSGKPAGIGKISAGRLRIHNVVASRASAALELDHGKLKISDFRADLLGENIAAIGRRISPRGFPPTQGVEL